MCTPTVHSAQRGISPIHLNRPINGPRTIRYYSYVSLEITAVMKDAPRRVKNTAPYQFNLDSTFFNLFI